MRDRVYERIVAETAEELSMTRRFVDRVYKSYWKAVREYISTLPLKDDLTDEEFALLRSSVNIPSIGKLYVAADKYRWLKDKFEYIRQIRENSNVEDNKD